MGLLEATGKLRRSQFLDDDLRLGQPAYSLPGI